MKAKLKKFDQLYQIHNLNHYQNVMITLDLMLLQNREKQTQNDRQLSVH